VVDRLPPGRSGHDDALLADVDELERWLIPELADPASCLNQAHS
jgi:hypothetical protein